MSLDCLGVLIYNREDLLARLVASIDHPIRQLVIVNNGALSSLDAQVKQWVEANGKIDSWTVYEPGQNLGVAGGWNVLLHHAFKPEREHSVANKTFGERPVCIGSILICGNDIVFQENDISIFERTLSDFPEADFIFGNHSFSNFIVKRSGYEKLGTFDENFEIGYCEDADFWQRVIRTPAKAIHAAGLNSLHAGSATINSDAVFKGKSQEQHRRNWKYYSRKWGCPEWSHAKEKFSTPFNKGGNVNHWKIEGERLRRPHYLVSNP